MGLLLWKQLDGSSSHTNSVTFVAIKTVLSDATVTSPVNPDIILSVCARLTFSASQLFEWELQGSTLGHLEQTDCNICLTWPERRFGIKKKKRFDASWCGQRMLITQNKYYVIVYLQYYCKMIKLCIVMQSNANKFPVEDTNSWYSNNTQSQMCTCAQTHKNTIRSWNLQYSEW